MSKVGKRVMTEVISDLVKSNFKKFAANCPDRIVDDEGVAACCYHPGSASDCWLGICPRMSLSRGEAADLLGKMEGRRRAT